LFKTFFYENVTLFKTSMPQLKTSMTQRRWV